MRVDENDYFFSCCYCYGVEKKKNDLFFLKGQGERFHVCICWSSLRLLLFFFSFVWKYQRTLWRVGGCRWRRNSWPLSCFWQRCCSVFYRSVIGVHCSHRGTEERSIYIFWYTSNYSVILNHISLYSDKWRKMKMERTWRRGRRRRRLWIAIIGFTWTS